MKLIDKYLSILQSEYGYENPVQTRPKPKPGITGEDPEKPLPAGVFGPSGNEVDLEKQTSAGYDFRNFAQADYGEDKKPKKKKSLDSEK